MVAISNFCNHGSTLFNVIVRSGRVYDAGRRLRRMFLSDAQFQILPPRRVDRVRGIDACTHKRTPSPVSM